MFYYTGNILYIASHTEHPCQCCFLTVIAAAAAVRIEGRQANDGQCQHFSDLSQETGIWEVYKIICQRGHTFSCPLSGVHVG